MGVVVVEGVVDCVVGALVSFTVVAGGAVVTC